MTFEFTSTDLKRFDRKLQTMTRSAANKNLRKAMRVGGKILQAEVKAQAPKDTGALRRGVKVRSAGKRRQAAIHVRIGLGFNKGRQDTYYAAFLEYGTGERFRRPRGRAHQPMSTGKAPALGYMQKAFDLKSSAARTATLRELQRLLFAGVK